MLTLTLCGIIFRCQSYLQDNQHRDLERQWRVATEMSNLIVYCRSVAFNVEKIRKNGFNFNEMSSFPETKAEKLICQQENKLFLKYHQVCNALLFFVVLSLSKSVVQTHP
jgi:Phosphatidylinositol-specific phospholipase C, Y domain.